MTTSAREALATGDVRALVESVGPDEDWTDGGKGYLARIGRTNIMIAPDGDVRLHAHDTEEEAVECFRDTVEQLTIMLTELASQGPAGILAVRIMVPSDPGEATVPLPAVGRASVQGIREVSNEDPTATPPPTGLYL